MLANIVDFHKLGPFTYQKKVKETDTEMTVTDGHDNILQLHAHDEIHKKLLKKPFIEGPCMLLPIKCSVGATT